MKTCALCTRTTSPKNGVTTSSDAVLCHLCLAQYEQSPEYRREQYFTKAGHPTAAKSALTDYIFTALKIRQVEAEKKVVEATKPKESKPIDTSKNGMATA